MVATNIVGDSLVCGEAPHPGRSLCGGGRGACCKVCKGCDITPRGVFLVIVSCLLSLSSPSLSLGSLVSSLPVVRLLILLRRAYKGVTVALVGFVHEALGDGRSSVSHLHGAANNLDFCVRCDSFAVPLVVFHLFVELLYWAIIQLCCSKFCLSVTCVVDVLPVSRFQ